MHTEEAPVMTGPGDEMAMPTPGQGHGHLRASRADREHVVDVLKAAFVQDRLTQDELDARVGQALAARTYADLAALTADLPAAPGPSAALAEPAMPVASPEPAVPAPAPPQNRAVRKAVKAGAGGIAFTAATAAAAGLALGEPRAAAILSVFIIILGVVAGGVVALLIAIALKLEALGRNRHRGQLPPQSASGQGGQPSPLPPAADPGGGPRPRPRRPPGQLAVGPAS
jgi:Domain of unknown function (DUF1707)